MRIILKEKLYPLEAILNACYSFLDQAYFFLDYDEKRKEVSVSLKKKKNISLAKFENLKNEFENELIHCALRFQVAKNNKKIREFIVSRALFSLLPTMDILTDEEKFNYNEDPLSIAAPWEKNKKEK